MPRSLSTIAREIIADWASMPRYAAPYVGAMRELHSISDNYYYDTGRSVVLYFLSNARSWRGDTARRIKAELKDMLK